MTAGVGLVRIPTPQDIATDPAFTSGRWRDGATGLNLPMFLARHLGPGEARRRLDEAADIADGACQFAGPVPQPRPLPGHGLVWTDRFGVDHDPIFVRQVTVCGAHIPALDFQPAGTRPCPDCFDGDPS